MGRAARPGNVAGGQDIRVEPCGDDAGDNVVCGQDPEGKRAPVGLVDHKQFACARPPHEPAGLQYACISIDMRKLVDGMFAGDDCGARVLGHSDSPNGLQAVVPSATVRLGKAVLRAPPHIRQKGPGLVWYPSLHNPDRRYPEMLARLFLMRHGETEWSLSARHTGRTEVTLTENGERQARALGGALAGTAFVQVFSSPLSRAQRTCELAGQGAGMGIEPDLREWDYGEYEGCRTLDIRKTRPAWDIFRDGCPGGESPAQVSDRADRLIARLGTLQGDIALFSHGHFGRVLAVRWIRLPLYQAHLFVLGPASLSILGHEHARAREPVFELWNQGVEWRPASPPLPVGIDPLLSQASIQRWENEGGEIPPPVNPS